jgi:hypothetical protein
MRTPLAIIVAISCSACASMGAQTRSGDPNQPVGTTGTVAAPTQPTEVSGSERGRLPVGQELDLRLQTPLSSGTATAEQRFEATTIVDVVQDGTVLIPAGSQVRGVVRSVSPAGRVDRSGSMTLAFDQIRVNGREYPIRAMATQAFESGGIREEAGTVGTAGAVGAIVGGILGGLRGALIGAAVGGGGVIAATEGKDVELPAGTVIRIRFDSALDVRS